MFLIFFFCNISPSESEIGPHPSWKHLYSEPLLGKTQNVTQYCNTTDVNSGLMHANRCLRKEVSPESSLKKDPPAFDGEGMLPNNPGESFGG